MADSGFADLLFAICDLRFAIRRLFSSGTVQRNRQLVCGQALAVEKGRLALGIRRVVETHVERVRTGRRIGRDRQRVTVLDVLAGPPLDGQHAPLLWPAIGLCDQGAVRIYQVVEDGIDGGRACPGIPGVDEAELAAGASVPLHPVPT